MSVAVRPAVAGDAVRIAEIHVTAWQETYRHLIDPVQLDALDPADRVDRWREIILGTDEDAWVAELDGEVVAWATTSRRDVAVHPRGLELNGLYSIASAYGSGVGQALLDVAIGEAPAFLWSAADNPRAQAFYRRNKFAPDGARDAHPLLDTPVEIVRFVR